MGYRWFRVRDALVINDLTTFNGGEIGIKSRLLDRSLSLDIAGYYYRYSGLQTGVNEPARVRYSRASEPGVAVSVTTMKPAPLTARSVGDTDDISRPCLSINCCGVDRTPPGAYAVEVAERAPHGVCARDAADQLEDQLRGRAAQREVLGRCVGQLLVLEQQRRLARPRS